MLQNANNSKRNLNQRPVLESHSVAGVPNGAGRLIKLTQGKFAIVDDEDYERLSRYGWYAIKYKEDYYAARHICLKGKMKTILMHRIILGLKCGDNKQIDHINHITLDNRRCNIRICTHQQNNFNREPLPNKSSRFKGVSRKKYSNKWRVVIEISGRAKHLGYFNNEVDAAYAYDAAAKEYFGEFAWLNFGDASSNGQANFFYAGSLKGK